MFGLCCASSRSSPAATAPRPKVAASRPHQRSHGRQRALRCPKGAADRLTDAAAYELGHLGISANAINPGPVDTGWMDDAIRAAALEKTPLERGGTPEDTANLVSFLCSEAGRWVTGQLLYSNGGFRGTLG